MLHYHKQVRSKYSIPTGRCIRTSFTGKIKSHSTTQQILTIQFKCLAVEHKQKVLFHRTKIQSKTATERILSNNLIKGIAVHKLSNHTDHYLLSILCRSKIHMAKTPWSTIFTRCQSDSNYFSSFFEKIISAMQRRWTYDKLKSKSKKSMNSRETHTLHPAQH